MGRKKKSSLGKAIIRKKREGDYKKWTERHSELEDQITGYESKKMNSIIETNNLTEFLNMTKLENRDYSAEREVTLIVNDEPQTYELEDEEFVVADKSKKQYKGDSDLQIPRRPHWTTTMSKEELHKREKETFLEWRRNLASLEEEYTGSVLTPFEKNPEVWKQLWRVVERSHMLVQIVDCRNPLIFRSKDLAKYVKEVDENKRVLLLVNKADLLTDKQKTIWADYFSENNIDFLYFSAKMEQEKVHSTQKQRDMSDVLAFDEIDVSRFEDPRKEDPTHIFSREELLWYFKSLMKEVNISQNASKYQDADYLRIVIGFAGYPNVGKSSVVNVLSGIKVVSVGSTPGKTKHFQTIPLGDHIMLCDSPGLVFPSITTTKADMVVDGILPIDQLRDHRTPMALLCKRIPREIFEMIYGLKIPSQENFVDVDTILNYFCRARGMMSHKGVPNGPAASRILLKDYVKGKLLYCHPPPTEFLRKYFSSRNKDLVEEEEVVEDDGEDDGDWEDVSENSGDEELEVQYNEYNANIPELENRQIEKQNQKKLSKRKKRAKRDKESSDFLAFNHPDGSQVLHNVSELKRRIKNEKRNQEIQKGAHKQKKFAGKKRNQQTYQPKKPYSSIPMNVLKDMYVKELQKRESS